MPTTTPIPPALPDIEVPMIDPKTGLMTREWYRYFVFWQRINTQIRLEIP